VACIGLSTYSFHRALADGSMKLFEVIDCIREFGGEHVEIVPAGFTISGPEDARSIRAHAEARGLMVSNYAIGANFLQPDSASFEREVERVKREVEIAHALGAGRMRHDAAWAPPAEATIRHFESALPQLAEGCARVADFAAGLGVTTSVENHGYFVQASDRVQKLLFAVDRPNFRTTLDVGNFLCADEDPVAAVRKNIPYASMVHLKDFCRREPAPWRQEGFFPTAGGHLLRGTVLGYGDLDLPAIVRELKTAGYDGFLSVEFEGQEDERWASRIGLQAARILWGTV
jgi:inosose dehydratase